MWLEILGVWLDRRGATIPSMMHRMATATTLYFANVKTLKAKSVALRKRVDAFRRVVFPCLLRGRRVDHYERITGH